MKDFASCHLFKLDRVLQKFLAIYSTTMKSPPLKKLDFGLHKPTGPTSGVVTSMIGLLGVSLAESQFYLSEVSLVELVFDVQYL